MTTSELVFSAGGRTRPLKVERHPRLRGMRLRIDPRDASVILSLSPRMSVRQGLAWAATKRPEIEAMLARAPVAQPIEPRMVLSIGGATVRLDWREDAPRIPRRDGDVLVVGGPRAALAGRVLRYLRAEAGRVLETETRALAEAHGLTMGRVGVGDPVSRWGSCASSGNIRYSWRLILAPEAVRRATVAHEVAHLVHMNHGALFHALVASLLGADPAPARRWLRANGAALHGFGREG